MYVHTYDVCAMEGIVQNEMSVTAHIGTASYCIQRRTYEKGLRGLSLRFRTLIESTRVYPYSHYLCTPVCTVAGIGTP